MASVEFSRAYSDLERCDMQVTLRTAIHSFVDPITEKRRVTVYTDDGHGNGIEILTVFL